MKSKPVIYVAGPYSSDHAHGVRRALEAAERIWAAGGIPVVPHLTHFWDLMFPHEYEKWMDYDEALLARCDALVRIPGTSAGADREVAFAVKAGMPVFLGSINCVCGLNEIQIHQPFDSARRAAFQECFEEQCQLCKEGWPVAKHAHSIWRHSGPEDPGYPAVGSYLGCEASHLRNLLGRKGDQT